MSIKITAADKWFSLCIRLRANWCCERCGTSYGGPSQALHCSHLHGRGKYATRFDPRNARSICYGCHQYLGAQPEMHRQWFREHLGPYDYDALTERAQDQVIARQVKREIKAVSAHYREQFRVMTPGQALEGYV